jgi:hypothetical protein
MRREYVVCYAFRRRRAPLGPLGPEETIIHVGRPGFFSLGYTLCGRKVSRRIDSSPVSEATCRDCNGAGNWPPGLRPNNKGKLSCSAAAPKRRPGLENGRSSSVRGRSCQVAASRPNEDTSLVSVVLLVGNQGRFGRDLREQVRQDTWRSAGVRYDCHSVSHSAAGSVP